MKTVLAIDGGGVRALIPLRLLAALQRRLPAPLASYFDLIAGTSSGAIVALCLARPDPWSPDRITEKLLQVAPEIFAKRWRYRIRTFAGLLGPRYDVQPLELFLEDVFGSLRLSDLTRPVMVPAVDIQRRRPVLFRRPSESPPAPGEAQPVDYLLREVLRATTAAPTFFRPAQLLAADGQPRLFIDGGLVANNPSVYALASLDRGRWLFSRQRASLVLSLGTGRPTRAFPQEAAMRWGAIHWFKPLVNLMAAGLDNAIDHAVSQGFESDQYHRFQIDLDRLAGDSAAPKDELDNATAANLALLVAWGERLAAERSGELDQLAQRLIKNAPRRTAGG